MLRENTVLLASLCLPLVSSALILLRQTTCPLPAVTKSTKKINKRRHKQMLLQLHGRVAILDRQLPQMGRHGGSATVAKGST